MILCVQLTVGMSVLKRPEGRAPAVTHSSTSEFGVMPTGGGLAPEVGRAGEGRAIEELIFDEAMNGLDITLPGVTLGRDATMI